jgi:hypothetical protein
MDEPERLGHVDRRARAGLQTRPRGAAELLLDGVPQVVQQVEAVAHLPRLRRAFGGAAGVQAASVAADQLDLRAPAEPAGGRCGGPVRQDVEDLATLQVDDDRPVGRSLAPAQSSMPTTRADAAPA